MNRVASSDDSRVDINELLEEFYADPIGHSQLADFEALASVPQPYNDLLDHNHHMTVTVESHYGEKVDVHVHRRSKKLNWYCREITLATTPSRRIVQYGIVRLDTTTLEPEVWQQIESEKIPLGRVLIEHNVLREVELCGLWRVKAGPRLASLLHLKIGDVVYGRTALIHCDKVPAIELLEILAPTSHKAAAGFADSK